MPDYLVVWWIGLKIGQWEDTIRRPYAVLKNRMEFDMSDSIGWIAFYHLFLSLREMHYGINITNIVCHLSGSGNEKSDGIWANINRIRLRPSTRITSHSLKWGNGTPALSLLVGCQVLCPLDDTQVLQQYKRSCMGPPCKQVGNVVIWPQQVKAILSTYIISCSHMNSLFTQNVMININITSSHIKI